ncbi:MAG TPA: superoxide dismutase [Candidatus Nitrosotenuis sp.]|nr:superoxide dismutase [Candidatus Nitrosotenuis sp.]
MELKLPPLPYNTNALEPFISTKTLELHYGKHHQGYVDKLNESLSSHKNLQGKSLEDIILTSVKDESMTPIFNNAAQTWNHTFYWRSMKEKGGGEPKGELLEKINADFGSFNNFRTQFIEVGTQIFGSGWVWLVLDHGKLKIVSTKDAQLPLTSGQKALLTCDIWEHAYYLDYQNRRKNYIEVFLDHLVNWDFAAENFKKTS